MVGAFLGEAAQRDGMNSYYFRSLLGVDQFLFLWKGWRCPVEQDIHNLFPLSLGMGSIIAVFIVLFYLFGWMYLSTRIYASTILLSVLNIVFIGCIEGVV